MQPGNVSNGPSSKIGWLWLVLLPVIGACGLAESSAPPTPTRSVSFARMVDLSHTITQDMPHPPAAQQTELVRDAPGAPVRALMLDMRSGTSLRSVANGAPVDRLSPRDTLLPAVVLDVRDQAQDTPTYQLRAAAVRDWEAEHGTIPAGSLVLLATGWDIRWGHPAAYLNLDARQQMQVPTIQSDALALLAEREVAGVGIDTPRLSATPAAEAAEPDRPWLLLENLTRLEQLPPTGSTVIIGVLKVQGSHASPASVRALVP